MINIKRIYAIFVARTLEFTRDRSAFIWQLLFPIMVVFAFAFSLSNQDNPLYTVGVVDLQTARAMDISYLENPFIQFVDVDDVDVGLRKVEQHTYNLLIDPIKEKYWINQDSKTATLVEALLFSDATENINAQNSYDYAYEYLSGTPLRYIDWMIPGVLSMNMMFSALFGIGYVIVRYRKNLVLKRLKATPTTAIEFLLAQLCSRFFIIFLNLTVIFTGLNLVFHFRMYGSYLDLFIVMVLGASSLLSLGLIVAARIRNEEVANGILSFITWPLMLLSEIWFSLETSPVILQRISSALPLSQITKLARAVMLEGKTLFEMPFQVGYLLIFSVVCLVIGSALFRWE